jgi:hypothetical protein
LGIKTRRRPNIGVNSDERNYHEAIAETQVPLGSSHISVDRMIMKMTVREFM